MQINIKLSVLAIQSLPYLYSWTRIIYRRLRDSSALITFFRLCCLLWELIQPIYRSNLLMKSVFLQYLTTFSALIRFTFLLQIFWHPKFHFLLFNLNYLCLFLQILLQFIFEFILVTLLSRHFLRQSQQLNLCLDFRPHGK